MKPLFKAMGILTIFTLLTRFCGFIFRIVLSRKIGAEGIGLFQIAMSLYFVVITVTSSGLPTTVSRQVSKFTCLNDRTNSNASVTASLVIGLLASVFLSIIFLIGKDLFAFLFTDRRCITMFLCTIPAIILSSIYSSLRGGMWGKKQYFAFSFVELIQEITMILGVVILINGTVTPYDGAMSASVSVSISYVVATTLTVLVYFLKGERLANPNQQLKKILKHSTPITLVRLSSTSMQSLIAFILPAMLILSGLSKTEALVEYGQFFGMTMPLVLLPSSFIGSISTALVPEIASLSIEKDNQKLIETLKKTINFSILLSGIFLPIFLGLGREIGVLLFDNATAGTYLTMSCWIMIPLNITQITATLLNSLELEKKSMRNFIISAVVLIGLMSVLPIFFGIKGAIISYGVGSSISAIMNIFTLNRCVAVDKSIYKNLMYIILLSVPCALLGFFIFNILEPFINLIVCIGISGVIIFASNIFLFKIFNIINFNFKNLKIKNITAQTE